MKMRNQHCISVPDETLAKAGELGRRLTHIRKNSGVSGGFELAVKVAERASEAAIQKAIKEIEK